MVSLLFIGNSYTFYNELNGNELNGMVDGLLEEGAAAEGDPRGPRWRPPGSPVAATRLRCTSTRSGSIPPGPTR